MFDAESTSPAMTWTTQGIPPAPSEDDDIIEEILRFIVPMMPDNDLRYEMLKEYYFCRGEDTYWWSAIKALQWAGENNIPVPKHFFTDLEDQYPDEYETWNDVFNLDLTIENTISPA